MLVYFSGCSILVVMNGCWLDVCFYLIKLYMNVVNWSGESYTYKCIVWIVCRYTQVGQLHKHNSGRASALERLVVQSGGALVAQSGVSGEDLCPDENALTIRQRCGSRP